LLSGVLEGVIIMMAVIFLYGTSGLFRWMGLRRG